MSLLNKKVILVGGKGGVGKTTISSALALLAAQKGKKCLVISTDPAHSLADAFDRPIGDSIVNITTNLDGLEINPDKAVAEHLKKVTSQLQKFTRPDLFAEVERQMRLTLHSPGAQEAALLEQIATIIDKQTEFYDLVIFDTAPTGHTLRLLSLPEAMAVWTQGMLKQVNNSAQLSKVIQNLTPKAIDTDLLSDPIDNATAGMDERTKEIATNLINRQRLFTRTRRILKDLELTALLFVLNPEKLAILETKRAVDTLLLEGLPIAGLIVNRVLPDDADGEFLAKRRQQEQVYLKEIENSFSLPRYLIKLLPTDIQGISGLLNISTALDSLID